MKLQANGPFEVKLNPESLSSVAENTGLGRMSLDKQFHGDLEAVSHGEMLAFRSSVHDPWAAEAIDHRRARFRSGRIAGALGLDDHQHR